jgi:hypothetical protein
VRGLWRVFGALLLAAVLFWIGAAVYNAGVSAGLAEAARHAGDVEAGAVPPYGWGGPSWGGPFVAGWGPLALVFWTFVGVFLVIGLVRLIVGGRWNGPGSGSRGWRDRSDRVEEWHRELHRRDAAGPEATAGG